MDSVAIESDHCVLRDVNPVVYKVFSRIVWRWYPKRRMGAPKETDELEK